MHVIGLTGGIACGKSSVSAELRRMGIPVLDADKMAHELAEPGRELFAAYVEHFGSGILGPEGTLDRRAIADQVFQNPGEREWIDRASHPLLLAEMKRRIESCCAAGAKVVVLDVPLLFEAGWDALCNETWTVSIPPRLQEKRLMLRDHLSLEQVRKRIASQMSLEEKRRRADVVIDNSGAKSQTKRQVRSLMERFSVQGDVP